MRGSTRGPRAGKCSSSRPPGQTWDRASGSLATPLGTTTHKQNASLAYLVSVCSATEWGPPAATWSWRPPSPGHSIWERAEAAGGVEVEEGQREEGREDAAEQPLADRWPAAGPHPTLAWECVIRAARSGASFSSRASRVSVSGGLPPRPTPPSRHRPRSGSE